MECIQRKATMSKARFDKHFRGGTRYFTNDSKRVLHTYIRFYRRSNIQASTLRIGSQLQWPPVVVVGKAEHPCT
jgi:hypothetical protein